MPTVKIDKTIFRRVRSHDGLSKALDEFVDAVTNDQHPPRVYKKSGVANDGKKFDPYLKLDLHHHYLHRDGDPLLVTQHVEEEVRSVALARHSDYILGDKLLRLQQNAEAIEWDGNEDLHEQIISYVPKKSRT
jgi:hypothetical protein